MSHSLKHMVLNTDSFKKWTNHICVSNWIIQPTDLFKVQIPLVKYEWAIEPLTQLICLKRFCSFVWFIFLLTYQKQSKWQYCVYNVSSKYYPFIELFECNITLDMVVFFLMSYFCKMNIMIIMITYSL